jgi:hypothetical protein
VKLLFDYDKMGKNMKYYWGVCRSVHRAGLRVKPCWINEGY